MMQYRQEQVETLIVHSDIWNGFWFSEYDLLTAIKPNNNIRAGTGPLAR